MTQQATPVTRNDVHDVPGMHREHQRPGRPHRLSVRLSDDERDLVAAAAAAARLTPSGYAGKAAVAAASSQITPAAGQTEVLRELLRELFAARRALNMLASNVNQAAAAYNSTGELPDWTADAVALSGQAVTRLDEVARRVDRRLR